MIDRLEQLVQDTISLNCKLVLLIGPSKSERSEILNQLCQRSNAFILNVGTSFSRHLLPIPNTRRHIHATDIFKSIVDDTARHGILLLDNVEVLFDRTLQLDPLDLLKRQAYSRCVVATWPGELAQNRLTYAASDHPEHQDYSVTNFVPFELR